MRKVYVLSLLLLTAASGAFAQRSIDWSLDEMIKPTQILSNADNRSTAEVHAVMKLVSGDSAFVGDTVVMVMLINTNPPVQGGFYFLLNKDMGVGDTVHWKNNLTINVYLQNSGNVNFAMGSFIRNGSQITAEVAPGTANNQKTKAITWWNKQGWNVSVTDVATVDMAKVYPNPATSEVTIDWNLSSSDDTREVVIYDLNGREVLREDVTGDIFKQSLNIEGLNAGMYMVELTTGDFTTKQKLQVTK